MSLRTSSSPGHTSRTRTRSERQARARGSCAAGRRDRRSVRTTHGGPDTADSPNPSATFAADQCADSRRAPAEAVSLAPAVPARAAADPANEIAGVELLPRRARQQREQARLGPRALDLGHDSHDTSVSLVDTDVSARVESPTARREAANAQSLRSADRRRVRTGRMVERYTKSRAFEERRRGPSHSPRSVKLREESGLSAVRTA